MTVVPRLDAVVFDLDDTLLDWSGSIRRVVADLGGDDAADALLAHAESTLHRRRDGLPVIRRTWALHEEAEAHWPRALPDLDPQELAHAVRRFREELWVGFYPDVVPTLDRLVEEHRLAVLSNNRHLPSEVERLRLRDWFEHAVVAPSDRRKPHPDAFGAICRALDVRPEHTVHVGDSIECDAEGAHAAGLISVWLDRHGDGWIPPAGVHRITSLAELPELLARVVAPSDPLSGPGYPSAASA
jgi:putative hydrolase of the HAD superfamily